ncbi:MAG: methyltransferase [Proteobacteria bacterium]|nr:MAG: methyltransferase [Pseudomonadota bacterium]
MKADRAKNKRRLLPGLAVADGLMRHPFDVAHGVRTSGLVAGRNLKSGHRHDRHATAYYGVAPSVFRALVARWCRTSPTAPIEDTTFVDIGAGMGRAVLMAAEMRFRFVLGVELNPTLLCIARRNLAAWRKTDRAVSPVRMLGGDAAECIFPSGPCIAFLFNPFGSAVMRRMLHAIAGQFACRPGQLDILYVNNEQEGVLESQPGLVRLFHGQVKRSRVDALADHRILANQPDGEYASADYEDCSIWRWVGKNGAGRG